MDVGSTLIHSLGTPYPVATGTSYLSLPALVRLHRVLWTNGTDLLSAACKSPVHQSSLPAVAILTKSVVRPTFLTALLIKDISGKSSSIVMGRPRLELHLVA